MPLSRRSRSIVGGRKLLVFGHGIVERGSHLVEFMPIGSHHTWNGLLFIKGGVGMLALAVPLAWTFLEMLLKAQRDRTWPGSLGDRARFLYQLLR